MNPLRAAPFNRRLAEACQAAGAACCCKGLLFLPEPEYHAITMWIGARDPAQQTEFESRTEAHGGFRLYHQRDRCQFLDHARRCRLHEAGVKPTECFWWPYHVYTDAEGGLEIRVCTSCCEGHRQGPADADVARTIELQARAIGLDVLRAFRRVYAGSYATRFVVKIPPGTQVR